MTGWSTKRDRAYRLVVGCGYLFLDRLLLAGRFDFLERVEPAGAGSRTNLASFFPISSFLERRTPEGPGATLNRPRSVNAALSGPGIEHDAVAIGVLNQTLSGSYLADELSLEGIGCESHFDGHRLDFGILDPHVARFATATLATLRAFKSQSLTIPSLLRRLFFLL
jgi:hypothetical protein